MKALILAAGHGTRLGQMTAKHPKPMLRLGGRPLLQHTMTWLRDFGIVDIAVNLHSMPESITDFFGSGASLGVNLTYSRERELLGTAGAAKQLAGFLDETFVVVYGDVLTNLDLARLSALHRNSGGKREAASVATLALYRVPNPTECGLVEFDQLHRVTAFVEKPMPEDVRTDLAFSGVMICEPSILGSIPEGSPYDFGNQVFPDMLERGVPMFGYPILDSEYVIDIGTVPGFRRALRLMWQQGIGTPAPASRCEGAVYVPSHASPVSQETAH